MLNFILTFGQLLLACGFFGQAGLLSLRLMRAKDLHWSEWAGLAFGLGVGLVSHQMLLFAWLGWPLALGPVVLPWGLAWAVYLIVRARRAGPPGAPAQRPSFRFQLNLLDIGLIGILGVLMTALVVRGAFHPVFEWDGWAIWDLKARAFYYHQSILPFVNDVDYALSHLDYPLLYPLAGTLVYLFLGRLADGVTILPALFYAATLGTVYGAGRRYGGSRTLTLGLTVGFALLPNVLFWSQQFYAEMPFLFYVLTSGLWLFFFLREPRFEWLLLSALLAGWATQTKIDGLLLILPSWIALAIKTLPLKRLGTRGLNWKPLGTYTLVLALAYLPWFIFRYLNTPLQVQRPFGEQWAQITQRASAFSQIALTLGQWMLTPAYQYLFFLLYPITVIIILCNWKQYRSGSMTYWLAYTGMMLVPSSLLFVVEPIWLEFARLGRYLVGFTAGVYLLLAFQVITLVREPLALQKIRRAAWSRVVQRLAIGIMFLAIGVDLGADLWRKPTAPAPFTSRPIGLIKQVSAEARELLPLSFSERQQVINGRFARPDYGRLLQVVLEITPEDENVALWVRADNTDDYLARKATYWLYPRKIIVVHEAAELTPERLHTERIGTVMVYDYETSTGDLGAVIDQPSPPFAIVRTNSFAAATHQVSGFTPTTAALEHDIRLNGYQVISSLVNEELLILLHWEPTQPLTRSYTVFVHLFSAETFVAQDDALPVLGRFPTQLWSVGQTVLDAHWLALPRSQRGNTKFCVGMYDSETLQRLPIKQANGYEVGDGFLCHALFP